MKNLVEKQQKQIQLFREEILKANKKLNLLSRKDPENQFQLLLEGSLIAGEILKPVLNPAQSPVLDIGSGGGFPGLILALLFPKTPFVLCERRRKKVEFLKSTALSMDLKNVEVLCQSAESITQRFEMILSQACAPLDELLKILDLVLEKKGQAFLWQSPFWRSDFSGSKDFEVQIFQSYKIQNLEKVLLKVQRN